MEAYRPTATITATDARRYLADFMISTAERYQQLAVWHILCSHDDCEEQYKKTSAADLHAINKYLAQLGGIEVEYNNPADGEFIAGRFSACVGYSGLQANGEAWLMTLTDHTQNHGTTVPIQVEQLRAAMKLA